MLSFPIVLARPGTILPGVREITRIRKSIKMYNFRIKSGIYIWSMEFSRCWKRYCLTTSFRHFSVLWNSPLPIVIDPFMITVVLHSSVACVSGNYTLHVKWRRRTIKCVYDVIIFSVKSSFFNSQMPRMNVGPQLSWKGQLLQYICMSFFKYTNILTPFL